MDRHRWDGHADPEAYGRQYLWFTVHKIVNHRSGSAERAVGKLTELACLLGRDDVVTAMNTALPDVRGAEGRRLRRRARLAPAQSR